MGKKLRNEDLVLNVIVNGDRGKKEIGELERAVKDTNKELRALEKEEKKLARQGKQNTEAYKSVKKAIDDKNKSLDIAQTRLKTLRSQLDVNKMSLIDLRNEMNRVRRLRDFAEPLTDQWRKHDDRLKLVSARYNELRGRATAAGASMQGMATKFNQYIGAITAGAASMFAAMSGVRRTVNDFAEFDEKVADASKTTQLAKEVIREMSDELKGVDTRTAQNDLLGLIRVAGKLGIEGREDILGFVRASDQIGVALSQDLGGDVESAITAVGKLVDIFKLAEEIPLEDALLKVGSSINELGMASTASEGNIVDFTRRLAGVGPLANISITDLMGLGATLDSLSQTTEVSSTALSKLFLAMAKNVDIYAKYANMPVDAFRELIDSDANEAFIRVLEGVKKNSGGLTDLAATLGDLGQDGGRVIGVLGTLADNTEKLRVQQELSSKAFEEGTSVTNEFALKNETAQAQLEKAQKALRNISVEIGEKLMPVLTGSTSGITMLLQVVNALFDFVRDNWRLISVLTAAVVAYNVALFASTNYMKAYNLLVRAQIALVALQRNGMLLLAAAQALFTGNITRATAAMRVFNAVSKLNPWVMLASVIAAATVALYQYSKGLSSAEKAQKKLNDVRLSGMEAVDKERLQMEQLLHVARDNNRNYDERIEAIRRLKEMAPGYLDNLSLETVNTEEATKATERYIESLIKKATVQSAIDEVAQIDDRLRKIKEGQEQELNAWQQTKLWTMRVVGFMHGSENEMIEGYRKENRENLEADLTAQRELLSNFINENTELTKSAPAISTFTGAGSIAEESATSTTSGSAAAQSAEDKARERELQKQAEYRQKVLESQLSLIEQERLAYRRRLEEAGIFGKLREDMTEEEIRVLEALQREHYTKLNELDANAMKTSIDQKQAAFEKELQEMRISHNEQYKEIRNMEQARAFLQDDLSKEALNGLRNMRQAQQEIDKKFRREEETMVKEHLQELRAQLESVLDSGQWEGLDLADNILSEEERELINARLDDVRQQLSELGLGSGTEIAEERGMRRSNVDILGFQPSDWELFFDNMRTGRVAVEDMVMATQSLSGIWGQFNELRAAGERRAFQEFEANSRAQEQRLRQQLDRGLISQERYAAQVDRVNADLDKKRAVYERNQAKRERNVALMSAIVNTSAAIAKALPNLLLAGLVGAMGGLQIGTILKTPLPEIPGAQSGGYMDVVRSQDRKMFKSRGFAKEGFVDQPMVLVGEDGSEFVANRQATENPTVRPILDAIDTAQRNGTISTINLEKILAQRMQLSMPGRQRGGFVRDQREPSPTPGTDPEMMKLIRENKELMQELKEEIRKGIRARVGLLGRDGFFEAVDDYERIEKNVNL